MKATITKILNEKMGNGTHYLRVEFKSENGDWLKTDVCPEYRNYRGWKGKLEVGNFLGNLKMTKNPRTIDADSRPELLSKQLNLL